MQVKNLAQMQMKNQMKQRQKKQSRTLIQILWTKNFCRSRRKGLFRKASLFWLKLYLQIQHITGFILETDQMRIKHLWSKVQWTKRADIIICFILIRSIWEKRQDMFQVTLQITAGIQRKIFISCFRLRQNLHRRQWMIIIQKICRSRRKQKKIFRQIIPARELFQRAVQMRCQIRSGRSDHWKEILQKKHRIRTKILIA